MDQDGYPVDQDCDDDNAAIHPGAEELCDGLDSDCDELTD
ncbi:MAG: putative metal-binding motif-containing protein [Myxococcota bacterium]|nr:putative metal-binding motif-containing protein [Myxococcota bacterium]